MKRKTSSKLKSTKAKKAWDMALEGANCQVIGLACGYTTAAITQYLKRRFKNESFDLWAKQIKAVGACEICGATENNQGHHLLCADTWPHLSRDLSNGVCLCAKCHKFNVENSPHTNLPAMKAFYDWVKINRSGQFIWYDFHKTDAKFKSMNLYDWEIRYEELAGIIID